MFSENRSGQAHHHDAALLRTSAAKKAGVQPPPSDGKDLRMSAAMADDSYGECFPDTYEGYNLALHGPDEEDELGIVRSKSPEPLAESGGKGGKGSKGGGGKRGGVDVEAMKREAKMDRELVQIEKLMEERSKKRQKRDQPEDDD